VIDYTVRTQDYRERWRNMRSIRDMGGFPIARIETWHRPSLLWRAMHRMGVR